MLGLFENIVKAGVGVVLTPITAVKDVVMFPVSLGEDEEPFEDTEKMAKSTIKAIEDTFDLEKW